MKVIRVCAAIIRNDEILMVLHQHNGREYWTLPGGGVDSGETPEEAVIREVLEETGLTAKVSRFLFDSPFKNDLCSCFLMEVDQNQEAIVGYDPEEAHMPEHQRMLKDVSWHSLESMKNDTQVSQVIKALA